MVQSQFTVNGFHYNPFHYNSMIRTASKLPAPLVASFFLWIVVATAANAKGPQPFRVMVSQPAYCGLPVWLDSDLKKPFTCYYPFSLNPVDFGMNRIELRDGDKTILVSDTNQGQSISTRITRPNHLPLHVLHPFATPGKYWVRWSVIDPKDKTHVLAQSEWIKFKVQPTSIEKRLSWLQMQTRFRPFAKMPVLSYYLPSLLCMAPDKRAMRAILEKTHSHDEPIAQVAINYLLSNGGSDVNRSLFNPGWTKSVLKSEIAAVIELSGPNAQLTKALSLFDSINNPALFNAAIAKLDHASDIQVADALDMLDVLAHKHPDAKNNPQLTALADDSVLCLVPSIRKRQFARPALVNYLSNMSNPKAAQLLQEVGAR